MLSICIYAAGMPFDAQTIADGQSLGGSETAAYCMAKELAKLDHVVTVWTVKENPRSGDGVNYEWIGKSTKQAPLGDRWHYVMQCPHDVIIGQRHPMMFRFQWNSKCNIWWLHDLALKRNFHPIQQMLCFTDKVFTVSEFHRQQVHDVYDIPLSFIYATKNGIDITLCPHGLKDEKDISGLLEHARPDTKLSVYEYMGFDDREQKSLFFAARPERGLENLVVPGGIMEKLPDYHLYVAGYDNTTTQMRGYYEMLWGRCEQLPNVTNLGALSKQKLYEVMGKVQAYIYPTTFEDTSCILAMEAQVCGTPFIGPAAAALPETLLGAGAHLIKHGDKGINKDKYIKHIKRICERKEEWNKYHNKAKSYDVPTWGGIAKDWNEQIEEIFKWKTFDKRRLWAHLERMSDIVALEKDGANAENCKTLRDNYGFYLTNNYKDHYAKYYKYEKDRGVNYGPESLDNNRRFEATFQIIKDLKPKRVLDYGCAHGHYTINLAKRLPDIRFIGMDLDKSNIDKATAWAESEEIMNAFFYECEYRDAPLVGKFDLILLGEVVEHVPDAKEFIEKLYLYCEENCRFVITVPYGPWEAIGYELHPGWRAHLQHFERKDLAELFGKQPNYKVIAIPHAGHLGHHLVTWTKSDIPIGQIDYKRKIKHQAPQETLSVCMIASNEEQVIGKTLHSIKGIAQEIIVGIDERSKDRTEQIAEEFGAEIIKIKSPLDIGFDEARNETIKRAKMDWILWLDADEVLHYPERIHQYLRPSCVNAFGIAQQHFACEPPGLFKTDYPARLFRNKLNMKFYGIVHEHPELGLNKGYGKSLIIPDMYIMHTGYATERIRRDRFKRNFPLMKRDREKYPNRILGSFLWVRDLAHINKYRYESNGGIIDNEIKKNCAEIVETWRMLIGVNNRLLCEGVTYLTEAMQLMGKGIKHAITIGTCPVQAQLKLPVKVEGIFPTTRDIKRLIKALYLEQLEIYDHKYY